MPDSISAIKLTSAMDLTNDKTFASLLASFKEYIQDPDEPFSDALFSQMETIVGKCLIYALPAMGASAEQRIILGGMVEIMEMKKETANERQLVRQAARRLIELWVVGKKSANIEVMCQGFAAAVLSEVHPKFQETAQKYVPDPLLLPLTIRFMRFLTEALAYGAERFIMNLGLEVSDCRKEFQEKNRTFPWPPMEQLIFNLLCNGNDLTFERWLQIEPSIVLNDPFYRNMFASSLSNYTDRGGIGFVSTLVLHNKEALLRTLLQHQLLSVEDINAGMPVTTPLFFAAFRGKKSMVNLLLASGANPGNDIEILQQCKDQEILKTILTATPRSHDQWQELVDKCFETVSWPLLAHLLENEPTKENALSTSLPIQERWYGIYKLCCYPTQGNANAPLIKRVYEAVANRVGKETINQPFAATMNELLWFTGERLVDVRILPAICTLPYPTLVQKTIVQCLVKDGADSALLLTQPHDLERGTVISEWEGAPEDAVGCAKRSNNPHLLPFLKRPIAKKPGPCPTSAVAIAVASVATLWTAMIVAAAGVAFINER
jgi:hypothetical protein